MHSKLTCCTDIYCSTCSNKLMTDNCSPIKRRARGLTCKQGANKMFRATWNRLQRQTRELKDALFSSRAAACAGSDITIGMNMGRGGWPRCWAACRWVHAACICSVGYTLYSCRSVAPAYLLACQNSFLAIESSSLTEACLLAPWARSGGPLRSRAVSWATASKRLIGRTVSEGKFARHRRAAEPIGLPL